MIGYIDRQLALAAASGRALPSDDAAVATVQALRRYFDGNQVRVERMPESLREILSSLATTVTGEGFSINVCGLIVQERCASLQVTGLETDGGDAAPSDALWELWESSQMGRVCDTLYEAACVDREAYLIPDYDADGQLMVYVNRRFDGAEGITVDDIGPDGEIRACEKRFTETRYVETARPGVVIQIAEALLRAFGLVTDRDAVTRQQWQWRYIYVPGLLRRYVKGPDGKEMLVDELPQVGMPVIRFTHPQGGELSNSILGVQDMINDSAMTLAHAGRTDGFRLPWLRDLTPFRGLDDDGDLSLIVEPGSLLQLQTIQGAPSAGEFGSLPPSDLKQLRDNLTMWMEIAAWLGKIPLYTLPSRYDQLPPSGRALMLSNRRSDTAAQRIRDHFTPRFQQLNNLLEAMQGQAPSGTCPVWRQSAYFDATEALSLVTAMTTANVDEHTIWQQALQLTPEQIERSEAASGAAQERQTAFRDALMPADAGGPNA